MYQGREVFPNAPLEFVAAEIRFPYTPQLRNQEGVTPVAEGWRELAPVFRPETVNTVTVGEQTSTETERQFRWVNKSSSLSITLQPTRAVVETTDYPQFEEFRDIIKRTVDSLYASYEIAGVERIGLRYIDEVRVPNPPAHVKEWDKWINKDLLASANIRQERGAAKVSGIVQYTMGDDYHLRLRYAAMNRESVVGGGVLRRKIEHPPGPFFLLDIDSFWHPGTELPDFNNRTIMQTVDDLHAPTGETFQLSITDSLRTLLRKSVENE